ncbi:MAG: hypothetical protein IIC24_08015, partial [Chloroflexi bacterium]|nr:hypothetical protein [Chloroflexota bacterium]
SLLELMSLQKDLPGGPVALSVVRQGIGAIRAKVDELTKQDYNAIVVDAETDSDLQTIARYSLENPDYLLVGSAGLAYAVGDLSDRDSVQVIENARSNSPVVIIAGSRHEATRGQVEAISSTGVAQVISMNPEPVWGERKERVAYSRQVMAELERFISDGRNVVLQWEDADPSRDTDESATEDANALANFAGLLVYGIARRTAIGGLIIAGGDTAFGVLRALGASTVDVEGEIEQGVPLGVIGDGVGAGLTIVTKAGGFGDKGLFVRALEVIRKPGGSEN